MNKIVYILSYNDETYNTSKVNFSKYKWAKPIKINSTIYLENIVYDSFLINNVDEWVNSDFVGTMSWKAYKKIKLPDLDSPESDIKINDTDVVAFFYLNRNIFSHAVQCHGQNFKVLWMTLLSRMGYGEDEITNNNIKAFFGNYWMAKPNLMIEYLSFFSRAKKILNESDDIHDLMWSDSKYQSGLSEEHIYSIFNKPYFPLFVFVLERLPCFYFSNHKILLY